MRRIEVTMVLLATFLLGCVADLGLGAPDALGNSGQEVVAGQLGQNAAGSQHTCALTGVGTIKCWGDNSFGQLGDGTTIQRTAPTLVSGISAADPPVYLVDGGQHTCAALQSGAVKCWGHNSYGQLGDGTTTDRLIPVTVSALSSVTTLAAGEVHTCAITNGAVKCWGYNAYGQLGDGTTTTRLTPVSIAGLSVTAIAAGYEHTCVVLTGGSMECWGWNWDGQLGDGTTTNRLVPTTVLGISTAVGVTGGWYHTCTWLLDTTGKCWGSNLMGGLGNGNNASTANPAVIVAKGGNGGGVLSGIASLSAGKHYTLANLSDASVVGWGANQAYTLGNYDPNNPLCYPNNPGTTQVPTSTGHQCWEPFPVFGLSAGMVTSIAAGVQHGSVLIPGPNNLPAAAEGWGANSSGQVGNGATSLYVHIPTMTTAAYP